MFPRARTFLLFLFLAVLQAAAFAEPTASTGLFAGFPIVLEGNRSPIDRAATSSNVIVNPGFESGATGWFDSGGIISNDSRITPHSGSRFAWLGGYDNANDLLYQDIVIPASAQSATLQFWYSITTMETSTTSAFDQVAMDIVNPVSGATLTSLGADSNLNATSGWVQSRAFDLTAYKGSTVRLRIHATTDLSNTTSFFFDDFSLTISTPASPPSTCTSCTIAPASNIFPYSGGGGQVAVSAAGSSAWTGTSNASWLSIASGASGTGNGTVTFNVAVNSGAQRVGTLNIGGQTFSVTQMAPPSAAASALIVEYHNSAQDDYFITADPAEQQALDAAAQAGSVWSRTGMSFNSGGSSSVYRFIYRSSTGVNTHFYTVNTSEQSGLLANYPMWVLESPTAYSMTAANADLTCAAGTVPVYRAANTQTGSHRFTTIQSAITEVLNRGWTNEGVAFCAPPSANGLLTGNSLDQAKFIAKRGYPSLFTLMFITAGLNSSGLVVPLTTPRRLETWAYNSTKFTSALFDNGFFIKENTLGNHVTPLTPTNLRPDKFTLGMTEAQIIALLGQPSCVETLQLAGGSIRVLRYKATSQSPVATVAIGNGTLVSVAAGYALADPSQTGTDICALGNRDLGSIP
jgi:hypothetical protein